MDGSATALPSIIFFSWGEIWQVLCKDPDSLPFVVKVRRKKEIEKSLLSNLSFEKSWSSPGVQERYIMQDSTENVNDEIPSSAPLLQSDYRKGFQWGRKAYEDQCKCEGRLLTTSEACDGLVYNIQVDIAEDSELFACLQEFALYDAGFLAGWLYAHLFQEETLSPDLVRP